MALSLKEQRKIIKALDPKRRKRIREHCVKCEMKGEGLGDILKSIGKVLGPIAKEIGPTVLKELVVPLLKSRVGLGLRTSGSGLKCAGCGHGLGVVHNVCKPKSGRRGKTTAKARKGTGLRLAGQRGPTRRRARTRMS